MADTLQEKIKFFITTHPFFIQMITGASVAAFAFSCLLYLGEDILEKEVISFDVSIVNIIYALRTPSLTSAMLVITAFGSATAFTILSSIVFIYLFKKKQKEAILFTLIFLSAAGLNLLLKIFFARPRPTLMPLVIENSYSFPSGHSMNSMVFYMMMTYFVYRNTKNIRLTALMTAVSIGIVGSIGFSRIYLGAHYPSDVLAGYATGILWCTIIIMIEKYIHSHRKNRKVIHS